MEYLTHRWATVTVAALGVGSLVAVLTSMTPALPDVQIREIDLTAVNIDVTPSLDIIENHVRPDIVGSVGAEAEYVNVGSLIFGNGDDAYGTGATFDAGVVDESVVNQLLGGSFDPQNLPIGVPFTPDLAGLELPSAGVFGGGSGQAVNAAAADVAANFSFILQALPDTQQALNSSIIAMEAEFNRALVEAQMAAAERLFGDNPEFDDLVNWIFSLNNSVLAQNEAAFNTMLGISYNPQDTLLGHFDPEILNADWTTMLGFSPDQVNQVVDAIQDDNLSLLLGSIDWDWLLDGLF